MLFQGDGTGAVCDNTAGGCPGVKITNVNLSDPKCACLIYLQ